MVNQVTMKQLIEQVNNALQEAELGMKQIQQQLSTLTPEERNLVGQKLAQQKQAFLGVVNYAYLIPNIQPWELNIWHEDEPL